MRCRSIALIFYLVSTLFLGSFEQESPITDMEWQKMTELVNNYRMKRDCKFGNVTTSKTLMKSAQMYADEVVELIRLGKPDLISIKHGKNGTTILDRVQMNGGCQGDNESFGYFVSENLSIGVEKSIEGAEKAFEASHEHSQNLISPFDSIGYGHSAIPCSEVIVSGMKGPAHYICSHGKPNDILHIFVQDFARNRPIIKYQNNTIHEKSKIYVIKQVLSRPQIKCSTGNDKNITTITRKVIKRAPTNKNNDTKMIPILKIITNNENERGIVRSYSGCNALNGEIPLPAGNNTLKLEYVPA